MNTNLMEDVANAVLYEGYLLYPYRPSAVKNRQRWNFGVLYPQVYSELQKGTDAWSMQTECLVKGPSPKLKLKVRFLQLSARASGEPGEMAQEAIEREVRVDAIDVGETSRGAHHHTFEYPGETEYDGDIARKRERIEGRLDVQVQDMGPDLKKVRSHILNTTQIDPGCSRDEALMRSFVSTHTILEVEDGAFISLLEPPEELRDIAAACQNIGTWPVLAGEEGQTDAMLSSPIILYDYPRIAAESPGALFDGTEIDEILTLRIMTLTDAEKLEMGSDARTREILERTESMPPEQFMKMHGVLRGLRGGDGRTP